MLAQLGQLDEAIADFSRVIEIKPRDVGIYLERARVFRAKGQINEAIADYQRIRELDPNDYYSAQKELDELLSDRQ